MILVQYHVIKGCRILLIVLSYSGRKDKEFDIAKFLINYNKIGLV